MKISALLFSHEIWNSCISQHVSIQWFSTMKYGILYSPYQNLGTNAPSWKDFSIVHIWRSEWRFSYKKYGNLYILHEKSVLHVLPRVPCHLNLSLTRVCLCCMCVCVHGSCPLRWRWHHLMWWWDSPEMWSNKKRKHEASYRLGETGPRISVMPLSRTGMRKGWQVTALDRDSANLQLHQEA